MDKDRKYKVLLIGTSSPHVANHLDRISGSVFDIHLVSNGKEFFPKDIPVTLVDFSLMRIWNFIKTPGRIKRKIRSFDPDVLHVHQANSVALYTLLANRKTKKPVVLTAWGSDILLSPNRNFLLKWMVRFILRRVNWATSDSVFMAEAMKELVPGTKLDIEICNFGVPETSKEIRKEKLVYSNRNHAALYRIDAVIKMFGHFTENNANSDWKMVIAGRGSETGHLKALVNELKLDDRVEFAGFVGPEENTDYYSRATFFMSLPESDATAMSLLEAMYYKCIPVLSDLPANREWVEDGVNGIIVKDLDEDGIGLASALDIEKAGEINRRMIEEKGTVNVSRQKFKEVLLKAIGVEY